MVRIYLSKVLSCNTSLGLCMGRISLSFCCCSEHIAAHVGFFLSFYQNHILIAFCSSMIDIFMCPSNRFPFARDKTETEKAYNCRFKINKLLLLIDLIVFPS